MQFIMKREEAALKQKTQAHIYHHCAAAISALETIPGGGRGAENLEEFGDSLLKVAPLVLPPLPMYDFRRACFP